MRITHKLATAVLVGAITTVVLLSLAEPSAAQVSTTVLPAMGATSPLAPPSQTGVPLGAVELNPGGLSPLTSATMGSAACSAAGSSGSTFDGGGLSGVPSGTTMPSTMSGRSEGRRVGKECRSRGSPYH